MESELDRMLLERLWTALADKSHGLPPVILEGPTPLLPSVYEVSALATASVALATAAAAVLLSVRTGEPARVGRVDRRHAAVAFRSERYASPIGYDVPPIWDPIAGDYATSDGWIRLHTNYATHRAAALRVLGVPEQREAVAAGVRSWHGEELENAIVAEGGCAAMMRTEDEFRAHPQGLALSEEPAFAWTTRSASPPELSFAPQLPLEGVRVLDLTRVIAGPVCTRFLAAYGATVLRIDPPGFEDVGILLGETTSGKRCAALDLRSERDRATFEDLVATAHVVVNGYRADAMTRLGFDDGWFARVNPSVVRVLHNAYGWTGPWTGRRGFDSLVQMSVGIAAKGRKAMESERPFPLPAQALDHATGYFGAAAACLALTRLLSDRVAGEVRHSLARTARTLIELGSGGDPRGPDLTKDDIEPYREKIDTSWGGLLRVRCPGSITGITPEFRLAPVPLGHHAARWTE